MQLLVFPLLGPLIGIFTFHVLAWANGAGPQSLWLEPWEFLAGYLLGLFPAFLTGICDLLLAIRIPRWWRIPLTTGAGFALSASMMLLLYAPPYVGWKEVLLVGCLGLCPAAACSWLSGINWSRANIG
jgi:hypothetical protein